ncbi:MAG: sigma-70 family polymerase sigma factor [Ferruginibacter sp.]|nr:sigma-70 family polymerase sigma factor [Ferruginibacter sp.]
MDKKNLHHIDDKEILELFQRDKNNELLGVLLQRYTMLLFGVCMKYLKNEEDAKDSVQQIFLKVISELHKYRVDYFKSWLYMVAKNHCLMKLRDKNKQTTELSEKLLSTPDVDEEKQTLQEKEASLQKMEAALKLLNTEQLECIDLFYMQKKTYQEISEYTGYSMMQVKSNIQNGKRNLKIQMQRMPSDEQ